MAKGRGDRSISFTNFISSGFSQTNVIAASIFPNIAFSSSLSSLSTSMNSISSASTFYVSCAEDITHTVDRFEKRSGDCSFVFREEEDDDTENLNGNGVRSKCNDNVSTQKNKLNRLMENSENKNDEIQRLRAASAVVISELKFKLRENKSQILANRGKLKGGDWNLELLKGNWENFVEWRTTLSEDRTKVERTIRHAKELLEDCDITQRCRFSEIQIPSNYRSYNHKLKNHRIIDNERRLFTDLSTSSHQFHSQTYAPFIPLNVDDSGNSSRLGKFILPREIPKPYERGIKERASFRSYTFSKLQNYRSKLATVKNPAFVDQEILSLDRTYSSTGDDDTLSEVSCNASFTTEDYDSGT